MRRWQMPRPTPLGVEVSQGVWDWRRTLDVPVCAGDEDEVLVLGGHRVPGCRGHRQCFLCLA